MHDPESTGEKTSSQEAARKRLMRSFGADTEEELDRKVSDEEIRLEGGKLGNKIPSDEAIRKFYDQFKGWKTPTEGHDQDVAKKESAGVVEMTSRYKFICYVRANDGRVLAKFMNKENEEIFLIDKNAYEERFRNLTEMIKGIEETALRKNFEAEYEYEKGILKEWPKK